VSRGATPIGNPVSPPAGTRKSHASKPFRSTSWYRCESLKRLFDQPNQIVSYCPDLALGVTAHEVLVGPTLVAGMWPGRGERPIVRPLCLSRPENLLDGCPVVATTEGLLVGRLKKLDLGDRENLGPPGHQTARRQSAKRAGGNLIETPGRTPEAAGKFADWKQANPMDVKIPAPDVSGVVEGRGDPSSQVGRQSVLKRFSELLHQRGGVVFDHRVPFSVVVCSAYGREYRDWPPRSKGQHLGTIFAEHP
jgi:hypothetical protein